MKLKRFELEKLLEDIKSIIDYVENSRLKDRKTTLYLANGEKLTYYVPESSIAHFLGIDLDYLRATKLFRATNSFDLLKEMCNNEYRLYNQEKEGHISFNQLFSEHIKEKIKAFYDNIKINSDETEFICNYNREKAFYSSEKNEYCDYIIVKKYEDGRIGIIYLAKNDNYCVPMSNQIFNNLEEALEKLKLLLKGQEITLITGATLYNTNTDYKSKFTLPLNSKEEKIGLLKRYKNLFDCSIDIVEDYLYTLDKLTSNRDEFFENNNITELIIESIAKGTLIDRNLCLDSSLLPIIDAWNDKLCSSGISKSGNVGISYTKAITSLQDFKQQLIQKEEENKALQGQVTRLTSQNEVLTEENQKQKEIIDKVYQITKPRN